MSKKFIRKQGVYGDAMYDKSTGKLDYSQTMKANYGNSTDGLLEKMQEIAKAPDLEELAKRKAIRDKAAEKIKTAFIEWLKEDHITPYKNLEVTTPNNVLLKLFFYQHIARADKSEGGLILLETEFNEAESSHKIIPMGVIVASNSENFVPGDVVTIPAVYGKTAISKEWIEYQKELREQPTLSIDIPAPPAYIGRLSEWANNIHQLDPFSDTSLEEQHVFCIPDRFIQTKVTK